MVTIACADNLSDMKTGGIEGFVRNDLDQPLEGAEITLDGTSFRTVTNAKGFYRIDEVPIKDYIINVRVAEYASASKKLLGTLFVRGVAYMDVVCSASVSIVGHVYESGDVYSETEKRPVSGAVVRIGSRETSTDENGMYRFDGLAVRSYVIEFEVDGYARSSREITSSMFRNEESTADVPDVIFWRKLFPGMTLDALKKCDKWYLDEYRGGRLAGTSVESMYHSFMSALDFHGKWENQVEGTTLISDGAAGKPLNMEDFESFVLGRKIIAEGNKVLTLHCRTHNATEAEPVVFGVQVIDLENPEIKVVGTKELNNNTGKYSDISFDLSEYVGKEIAIAVGIFKSCANKKQFVIRKMTFAPKAVSGAESYAGDAGTSVVGLEGWHFSKEMAASMMVNDNTDFNALPGELSEKETIIKDTPEGYSAWRKDKTHFMHSWTYNYVSWVPQPYAGAGFIMRTKSKSEVNKDIPVSYIYTKLPVGDGHNKLHFVVRTVQRIKEMANPAYIKFVVVTEEGEAKTLYPTKDSKGFEKDPVYRFGKDPDSDLFVINSNNTGGYDNYANVYYDLSEFNGKDVVVMLAMFHGENVDDKAADGARMAIKAIMLE